MIIDFHTHTFPDAIAPATIEKLGGIANIRPFTDGTIQGLKKSMQLSGVALSVLLPVATRAKQVPGINDAAIAMSHASENVYSFGCMHPDYDGWREELDRIAALGLKGIKIHPVYQGVAQDDPRYLRILDRAGELGLIVVTHGGIDIGYPQEMQCAPEKIAHAMRQVGPVKLVAAHMGGWCQWEGAEDLLPEFPNVWLDTSASIGKLTLRRENERSNWLLLSEGRFVSMVRKFGVERILFGTDSPWSDQKASIDWIQELPLSKEEKTAILGENARKLLKV